MIDLGLYLFYILLVIAVACATVFPLIYMVKNFQEAKKTLIGVVVLLGIFLLSYAIASGDVLPSWERFNISSGQSKLIGGGLISLYIMIGLSIVALVYNEVMDFFN